MNVPETFFSVHEELALFGLSCAAGAVIGAFYDVFRALRLMIKHRTWLVAAEDILFLGAYAVFLTAFASAAARGELRFYYAVGNLLGFTLYHFTLGSVVIRALRKLFGFVTGALKLIFAPVKRLYVFLRKKAADKFVGNSKNLVKKFKKLDLLLPKSRIMMYNKTENKKRKNVNSVAKKSKSKTKEKRTV